MARAKRHYIPGQIWHITQRCHKGGFLLRFKRDRYRWIQWLFKAKRRFRRVVLDRWTESIAVDGARFTERVKRAMRYMAKGRTIREGEGGFELRLA